MEMGIVNQCILVHCCSVRLALVLGLNFTVGVM